MTSWRPVDRALHHRAQCSWAGLHRGHRGTPLPVAFRLAALQLVAGGRTFQIPRANLGRADRKDQGHRYFVPPSLLRAIGLDLRTTLSRVQPHRLRALIQEDVERYPGSSSSEIHQRVGAEIPVRAFRSALQELVDEGTVLPTGERRWRRYNSAAAIKRGGNDVR